ncbi:MAG TPA: aminopeptidase [Chloroflexia bacterium]|nr:aminopeptidase [Chloroflexia bacterium]
MLIDPRIERMAKVLVGYSLGVQPGWKVSIFGGTAAIPLVQAAYREVLKVGAHPNVLLDPPGIRDMLLTLGSDEQLLHGDPYRLAMVRESDAVLRIMSDENTRASNNVPPERQALLQKGLSPMGAAYMQRITEGRPHSLTLFPTHAYAQDAEMSLSEFEDFVFHACLLDTDEDPVERWLELSREQQRIVDWLADKKDVHVEAPGTDLKLSIEGRSFVNSDGKRNFPSGEVFTSPVESTVGGRISFTYPASYQGRSVQGVKLTFKNGIVTDFSAESGQEFLASMLNMDAGARKMGEFAIGTNTGVTRITRNTLFDEKIAGTIHCALGEAYPNAGGTNHSAIHWDMVTDMSQGRIVVDGETLYENGKFVI